MTLEDEALNLLRESQNSIGGDWRARRDALLERASTSLVTLECGCSTQGPLMEGALIFCSVHGGTRVGVPASRRIIT